MNPLPEESTINAQSTNNNAKKRKESIQSFLRQLQKLARLDRGRGQGRGGGGTEEELERGAQGEGVRGAETFRLLKSFHYSLTELAESQDANAERGHGERLERESDLGGSPSFSSLSFIFLSFRMEPAQDKEEKDAMDLEPKEEKEEKVEDEDWREHIPRHCVPIRADVRTFDWKVLPPLPLALTPTPRSSFPSHRFQILLLISLIPPSDEFRRHVLLALFPTPPFILSPHLLLLRQSRQPHLNLPSPSAVFSLSPFSCPHFSNSIFHHSHLLQRLAQVAGPFDVILMDPPWQLTTAQPSRGVALQYAQLPISAIAALGRDIAPLQQEVPTLSRSSSPLLSFHVTLFLSSPFLSPQGGLLAIWVINAHYSAALEMLAHWGYTLLDDIAWLKVIFLSPSSFLLSSSLPLRQVTRHGRLAKGHGFYLQHAKETVLLACKVPPPLRSTSAHNHREQRRHPRTCRPPMCSMLSVGRRARSPTSCTRSWRSSCPTAPTSRSSPGPTTSETVGSALGSSFR